jgi:hypothetical protein
MVFLPHVIEIITGESPNLFLQPHHNDFEGKFPSASGPPFAFCIMSVCDPSLCILWRPAARISALR